ncbi:hypothetical protein BG616_04650 [Bacillus subtilis]|nr:hypothetical protein BG616_04650 [Bacillus subtilis]
MGRSAGIADQWIDLIEIKVAFLKSILGILEDANLSEAHIKDFFLEDELAKNLIQSCLNIKRRLKTFFVIIIRERWIKVIDVK